MADEKKCPYCAEIIKSEAVKCRYCGSELSKVKIIDDNSTNIPNQPSVASCTKCNVALVKTQKNSSISIAGIVGAFVFLTGLATVFVNVVVGILLIVPAVLTSVFGRGSKTIMVCPQCGAKGVEV